MDIEALAKSLGSMAPNKTNEEHDQSDCSSSDTTRSVAMLKTMSVTKRMRLLSQDAIDSVLPWHLEQGCAYHIISAGDVDSLTFLRHVVRDQRIKYVLLSTWCMAIEDAQEMQEWINRGIVDRFDFYVGEIFKDGYRGCRGVLDGIATMCGGRVARFRNHSKMMAVFGDQYDCVIESSANVNTNPRTEQTCITVDSDLAKFVKDYFDGVNDFDGKYKAWEPFSI